MTDNPYMARRFRDRYKAYRRHHSGPWAVIMACPHWVPVVLAAIAGAIIELARP